jgi:hypothetical protein
MAMIMPAASDAFVIAKTNDHGRVPCITIRSSNTDHDKFLTPSTIGVIARKAAEAGGQH